MKHFLFFVLAAVPLLAQAQTKTVDGKTIYSDPSLKDKKRLYTDAVGLLKGDGNVVTSVNGQSGDVTLATSDSNVLATRNYTNGLLGNYLRHGGNDGGIAIFGTNGAKAGSNEARIIAGGQIRAKFYSQGDIQLTGNSVVWNALSGQSYFPAYYAFNGQPAAVTNTAYSNGDWWSTVGNNYNIAANGNFTFNGSTNGIGIFQRNNKSLYINANYSAGNAFAQIASASGSQMGLSLAASDLDPYHLFLATNGYVGVRNANPSLPLDVNGNIGINGQSLISRSGGINYLWAGDEALRIVSSSGATQLASITNNGWMGIRNGGVPEAPLHVASSANPGQSETIVKFGYKNNWAHNDFEEMRFGLSRYRSVYNGERDQFYISLSGRDGENVRIGDGDALRALGTIRADEHLYTGHQMSLGGSGNGYGAVGYNIEFTGSAGRYTRRATDKASWVDFANGGIQLKAAKEAGDPQDANIKGIGGEAIYENALLTASPEGVVAFKPLEARADATFYETVTMLNLGTYENNDDALERGGLQSDQLYRTPDGTLKVVYSRH